jgi:hypothetical protein
MQLIHQKTTKLKMMISNKFIVLKESVQEIIDLIALKKFKEANNKLVEVSELLDEFLDFSEDDDDLTQISSYQVLLNQLHQKINCSDL